MSEQQCLWCGGDCVGGMDGVCRDCWEKYQFSEQEQPPTDMDIWNDLQRQVDQLRAENDKLRAENERLREGLVKISLADTDAYRENHYHELKRVVDIAEQALKEVKE